MNEKCLPAAMPATVPQEVLTVTPYKTAKSLEYNRMLATILPGGVHYNFHLTESDFVAHFVRGKGSRLWDMDGNEYLDLHAKFGALILGHANEYYVGALKKCLEGALTIDLGTLELDVCRLINRYVPCAEMVRFGLSGTEIIQNALRLSRAYTKKNRFIRFDGHYHGNADNLLGGSRYNQDWPIPEDRGPDLVVGTEGRARNILAEQSFILPWNDIQVLEETIGKYGDDIAAIIMEPICVNSGSVLPRPGYLEEVRELCNKHGIVLIFDEVITGFRVGLGGAQAFLKVIPDLAVFAKCISGGGVPVSALVGKREIMQLYASKRVIHAGTFNGYVLGLAAIKATLEILGRDGGKCYDEMCKQAKKIHAVMLAEARAIGLPLVIQGHPACASFHYGESEVETTGAISNELYTNNVIIKKQLACYGILVTGLSRIYPNISMTDEDVDFFKERVGYGLKDAQVIIGRLAARSRK
jgi:glutamate-1-semialdehyde 2,1-aminomutase